MDPGPLVPDSGADKKCSCRPYKPDPQPRSYPFGRITLLKSPAATGDPLKADGALLTRCRYEGRGEYPAEGRGNLQRKGVGMRGAAGIPPKTGDLQRKGVDMRGAVASPPKAVEGAFMNLV